MERLEGPETILKPLFFLPLIVGFSVKATPSSKVPLGLSANLGAGSPFSSKESALILQMQLAKPYILKNFSAYILSEKR